MVYTNLVKEFIEKYQQKNGRQWVHFLMQFYSTGDELSGIKNGLSLLM